MTKKLILLFLFFCFTPLTIYSIFLFPSFFKSPTVLGESTVKESENIIYSATIEAENNFSISTEIISQDSIPLLISNYLKRYNSPLLPYSDLLVEYAKKYSVDPRLIVAIAQQESNLGKKSPENCFNAWGWGIHKNGTKCYNNWPEAIESVIMGIGKSYCTKGLCEDPCLMMKKYTPSSNGSWCFGVNQFMAELKTGVF